MFYLNMLYKSNFVLFLIIRNYYMRKIYILLLSLFTVLSISAQNYEETVNKALDFIEAKEYTAAEEMMKLAMRKEPANPNNILLMVNLGTIQRNLGKFDDALISYTVAVEKYPDNTHIRHSRASLYCEMNKFDEALIDYNTILLKEPFDTEALYSRGLIHLSNKNLLSAEEDFKKINEINPDNLKGKYGLASVMKRRARWDEAEEVYSYLIYKNQNVANFYFNRAECYIELNKLTKALGDIKKAIELGSDDPGVYILRGKIRLAQYEKTFAKDDFLKAKELGADPEYIDELIASCK